MCSAAPWAPPWPFPTGPYSQSRSVEQQSARPRRWKTRTSTACFCCILPKLDASFPQVDDLSLDPEYRQHTPPQKWVILAPPLQCLSPTPRPCTRNQVHSDRRARGQSPPHLHEVPAGRFSRLNKASPAHSPSPAAGRPCGQNAQPCARGLRAGGHPRALLPPSASF